eukprot:COSAG02_NODE_45363_length_358_cov_0.532819_1_plen_49_part_01
MAPPVVTETDRDEYVGEFSGDKCQGEGRCQFANGDIYEGRANAVSNACV